MHHPAEKTRPGSGSRHPRIIGAIALALAAVLSACSTTATNTDDTEGLAAADDSSDTGTDPSSGTGTQSESVQIMLSSEPANLNVFLADEKPAKQILGFNVIEPLVRINFDSGEVEPWLAESYESISPTLTRFTLRSGVTFSDGSPLTAEVVANNVDYVTTDESLELPGAWLPSLEGAEVIDERTVELTHAPSPRFLSELHFMSIYGQASLDALDEVSTAGPIGTGPFGLENWTQGQQVTLHQRDGYWGDPPPFETMEFVFNAEPGVRVSAVQAGEVDVAMSIPLESADQTPNVAWSQAPEQYMIRFMAREPSIFANEEARQAVAAAIDREALVSVLRDRGSLLENNYPFRDVVWGFDPDRELCGQWGQEAYDPQAVSSLLSAAGADNAQVTFVAIRGRTPKDAEIAQSIASQMEAAGFSVDLQIMDNSAALDVLINKPDDVDMIMWPDAQENLDGWSLHAGIWLLSEYGDPPADADWQSMAEAYEAAESTEEAVDAVGDILDAACETVAYLPLVHYETPHGLGEGVQFDPPPDLSTPFFAFAGN